MKKLIEIIFYGFIATLAFLIMFDVCLLVLTGSHMPKPIHFWPIDAAWVFFSLIIFLLIEIKKFNNK